MAKTPRYDERVDAYIEKAENFAKPILMHLRGLVHETCPEVDEAMKWSMPFFTLGGKNLANMGAFKKHAVFGFWEGLNIDTPKAGEAMGHYGRITSLEDLPNDDEIRAAVTEAAEKLGQKKKKKAAPKKAVAVPSMPDDFATAIAANPAAQKTYDNFAPSYQRDYVEWIIEAKREATRQKRIAQAVEWMADGKDRNWKYR